MGQCLGLVAKVVVPAAEPEDEAVDGSALLYPVMMADLSTDSPEEPTCGHPGVTMRPKEIELIEKNRHTLVKDTVTSQISLERVVDELKDWIPKDKVAYFKDDKDERSDLVERLHEFYTLIQSLPVEEPFSTVNAAFWRVDCKAVGKIFLPLAKKPQRKPSRVTAFGDSQNDENNLEETDFADEQGDAAVAGAILQVMTDKEKELINKNMDLLISHTSPINLENIVKALSDCIPDDHKDLFMDNSIEMLTRVRAFYNFVQIMEVPNPYVRLVTAFTFVNPAIREILVGIYPKREPKPALNPTRAFKLPPQMIEEMPEMHDSQGDEAYTKVNLQQAVDRDNVDPNRIRVKPANRRMDLEINSKCKINEGPKAYKCGSNPKGLVLILNIHDYQEREDPSEQKREGSQYDRRDLEELFDQLGYDTIVYPENISDVVSEKDFKREIRNFAKHPDHFRLDSCFVVIMGHGEEIDSGQPGGRGNAIITSDHKSVPISWIKEQFSSRECPGLIGKPKVFIYQACRGLSRPEITTNPNHPITSRVASGLTDGRGSVKTIEEPIPVLPTSKFERILDHILVCHASPLGHVAHRNDKEGSFFIQAVIRVFCKHAHDTHVRDMMDLVDNEIRKMCIEKTLPGSQTSSIESVGFTRFLFISPDLYDDALQDAATGGEDIAG